MKGTFTLPDGQRVRTSSERRYVVFAEWHNGHTPRYRTDELSRARGKSQMFRGSTPYIVDTHTGETITP